MLPFSVVLSIVHFPPHQSRCVSLFLKSSPTGSNNQIRLNLPLQMSNDCVSLCVSCSWQRFTVQVSHCSFPKTSLLDEPKAQRVSDSFFFLFVSSVISALQPKNELGGRLSFIHARCCNTLQHRRRRMQCADVESRRLGAD